MTASLLQSIERSPNDTGVTEWTTGPPDLSITLSSSVTAGSILVCAMRWAYSSDTSDPTVSDDVNGAWTKVFSQNYITSSTQDDFFVFELLNAGSGTTKVTINSTDLYTRFRIVIAEFGNVGGYARLTGAGAPSSQSNTSTTTCSSGSITVPTGYEVLAVGASACDNDDTFTANSPFTQILQADSASGRVQLQYKANAASGSIESAATIAGAAQATAGGIILYGKPGGGANNLLLQWKDNASGDSVDAGISMKYTTG